MQSGLRDAIRHYWKYYLPAWLCPIYFCLTWYLILNSTNLETLMLLFGVPFFVTWLVSGIPYWRNKISFRTHFILYLINGGLWFASILTALFIKILIE